MRRYGEAFHENLQRWFERESLVYNPPPEVVSNSRTALRLTELARVQGRHAATHDRLMRAYWEQALDIGDHEVLRPLALELGLDGADAVLAGDLYGDEVAAATSDAHRLGINAVPAFLLDRRLIVLGAQADEVFEQAFAQLTASATEAPDGA